MNRTEMIHAPTIAPSPSSAGQTTHAIAIVTVAILVRLALQVLVSVGAWDGVGPRVEQFWTSTDGYLTLARNLNETGRFAFSADAAPTIHRAPAFPATIALAYHVTHRYDWAIYLVNLLAAAATALLTYAIARRFYAERIAYVIALLAGVFPVSVYYATSSFADSFLTMTVALFAWTSLRAFDGETWRWSIASGVALALSLLTKPILMFFSPLVVVFALAVRRGILKPLAIQIVVAAVLVAPWCVRNQRVSGRATPVAIGGGFNLLIGNFMADYQGDCGVCFKSALDDALGYVETHRHLGIAKPDLYTKGHFDLSPEMDSAFFSCAVEQLRHEPLRLIRKIAVNLGRFWYFASSQRRCLLLGLTNFPIVFLAAWELWRHRKRHGLDVLWIALAVLYTWGIYSAIIVHSRFYLVLLPLLLPFAFARLLRIAPAFRAAEDEPSALAAPHTS